jgi:surface protein
MNATNETISKILDKEIEKLGLSADLNHIDVSNVTNMNGMFNGSKFNGSKFNGDISKWDVSNVTDMCFMFCESDFNGDTSKWDVAKVTDMCIRQKKNKYQKRNY